MKATATIIENKIDELLVVLDKDIEQIRKNLSWLNELRSLVIKRNEADLCKLLDTIRIESGSYAANELKRQSIRRDLAKGLDWQPEQITLSKLESVLTEEKKRQVSEKKTTLRALTKQLKTEHLATTMLLSDCSRLNGQLLRGIFDISKAGSITYGCDGSAERQVDTAFVNLQF